MIKKVLFFLFLVILFPVQAILSIDLQATYRIPKDPTPLFKKANAGDAKAQFTLAYMYAMGYM